MNVDLLEHQVDFVTDVTTPFLGLVAGYRAGKTLALCHKVIYMAASPINIGYPFIVMEPTMGMVRRVLEPTLIRVLKQVGLNYTHLQQTSFTLHFPTHDHIIWLLSSENCERAQGISASAVFVDEIDLLPPQKADTAWKILVSRLTAGVQQACCCSTPEGYSWMYSTFVENLTAQHRLIKARTYDNPFIPPEYYTRMRASYPAQQLEAYLEGEFINLTSGSVYYQFDRGIHHIDKTINDFPNHILHVGQDFNVNKNASTISVIDQGIVYVIGEIADGKHTNDTINRLKTMYPNRQFYIYPDASGGDSFKTAISDVKLFKDAGMVVFNQTKNPKIKDRVAAMNCKFRNGTNQIGMYINTKKCPQLTKCIEQQGYTDGKPDKTQGLDHMVDAIGYFVVYRFPVSGHSTLQAV